MTKRVLLGTSCLRTPVFLTGHQVHPGKCTFKMAETRKNILTRDKARISGHRTRWKEKGHPVFHGGLTTKFVSIDTDLVRAVS